MVAEEIKNKQDLIDFLGDLRNDFLTNEDKWENNTLGLYLEALQGYLEDIEGYFQNNNIQFPDDKCWSIFGAILKAAKYYE